jgi:hypothetical protein
MAGPPNEVGAAAVGVGAELKGPKEVGAVVVVVGAGWAGLGVAP